MKQQILHCVAGLDITGGGLAELVPCFALEAKKRGHDVTLVTTFSKSNTLSPTTQEAQNLGVQTILYPANTPHCFYFSWQMLFNLPKLITRHDIIHIHGNWTFPVYWTCFWALYHHKTLVMSPQGSFDPVRLAYSHWKKRLVGWLDRYFLNHATLIHVTASCEQTWTEAYAKHTLPCVIIPNGVTLPENMPKREENFSQDICHFLYLGRIHKLKGIDLLLQAWQSIDTSRARLTIAGPNAPQEVSTIQPNVHIQEGVYGIDKWKIIQSCDILILPTRSENFGIIVAEALACGKPVICTQGAPWEDLQGNPTTNSSPCGWWTPVDAQSIAQAIQKAIILSPEDRQNLGENGRILIQQKYAWETVSNQMLSAYQRVST